jgi:glutamate/aspartate transport system substrate-binding protein
LIKISSESTPLGPYGLILRRDDPEFKKVVDDALGGIYKTDEINRIYAKWSQSPI